ncbi:MAG: alginate export family protein [Myxococcaceae bacterium]|nr:alginate export family protein [Myxococcaceae bacterium]
MKRAIAWVVVLLGVSALADEVDAGIAPAEPTAAELAPDAGLPPAVVISAPDAGTRAPLGFDVVATPWGPGRKSAGEKFHSTAEALPDGPLRWAWNGYSVALGGQYFARGELRNDVDFAATSPDHTLGFDQRARLSVRASAQERAGLLLEVQDVRAWGSEAGTVGVTSSTGLHQGFADVRVTRWLDVRAGRQELAYGEERLIGSLDWAQPARAFDGLFVRATPMKGVTVDAFAMVLKPPAWLVADAGGGRFHNSGSYFGGLYGRARFGAVALDLYGLGLFEDPSTAALGPMKDNNRVTLGARAAWTGDRLTASGEGAFQTGTVGAAQEQVLAGAFAFKVTYTLKGTWSSPYLLAEFSGATGDATPGDGTERTFHQLFPTAHAHLGYADLVAWQNVVAVHGAVGARTFGAHVWLDVHHFRAWAPEGAWTSAGGAVFLPATAGRQSGNMGTEVDLSCTVPVFDNVAVAGNVSVFMPGLEALAKGTSPSTWGFVSLRTQF